MLPVALMLGTIASNAARIVLFPALFARRRAMVPQGTWVEVRLHGSVSEIERPMQRWLRPLAVARAQPSVAALRTLFRAVAQDPSVGGVVLRLGALHCGWATATSLRELVLGLRAAGKRTVAYLPEGASTREYFVAVACDKVLTTPQAILTPLGIASGMTFLRGLLARGGIEAEVYARREYKSAAEAFTRDGYSEPNRAQVTALLEHLHGEFVRAIADGRRVDEGRARAMVDGGPYRPVDAVREGMIDGVAYDDELPLHLGAGRHVKLVKAGAYFALVQAMALRPMTRRRRVGLVEVRGVIVPQARFALGNVADAHRVTAALRAARAAKHIDAVVLYVDSQGGSALASDLIAREVERLREKKPVVAYFSDTAASGGYYVAAPAAEIVAQPTTVTGSIGVIAMRFLAIRALEKLGITHEVIRRGERADFLSPYRAWNDGDRAAFERSIDGFYNDFVAIVAKGRGRDVSVIEPLARGRVYAGREAFDVGLVDHLGGLDLALRRARELAGGNFDDEPVLVAPRGMPDPPEPPAAVQPLVAFLVEQFQGVRGGGTDLLHLALAAPTEHLFAFEDLHLGM